MKRIFALITIIGLLIGLALWQQSRRVERLAEHAKQVADATYTPPKWQTPRSSDLDPWAFAEHMPSDPGRISGAFIGLPLPKEIEGSEIWLVLCLETDGTISVSASNSEEPVMVAR